MELGLFLQPGDLAAEALDDGDLVEVEQLGIGAHEADRIGRPGQIGEEPLLDRFEVILADLQFFGDVGQT
ncbi:MAG: hypothetical protein P8Z76_18430 [Alphaproteobacteria bacterium]